MSVILKIKKASCMCAILVICRSILFALSMQVMPAMTSVHNPSARIRRIRRTNPRVQVVAQEAVSSGETWNTGASWCPHWPTYPGLIMWLAFKFWMPSDSAIIVTPWILSNPKSQVQEVQWRFVPLPRNGWMTLLVETRSLQTTGMGSIGIFWNLQNRFLSRFCIQIL